MCSLVAAHSYTGCVHAVEVGNGDWIGDMHVHLDAVVPAIDNRQGLFWTYKQLQGFDCLCAHIWVHTLPPGVCTVVKADDRHQTSGV